MSDFVAISSLVLFLGGAGFMIYRYRKLLHHDLEVLEERDIANPVDHEHDEEYVLVDYDGEQIRMTRYEQEHVWPKLTRAQKRAQVRPVAPKDRVKVEVNGEMVYTNREGSSAAAKQQEKIIDANGRGSKYPKRRNR